MSRRRRSLLAEPPPDSPEPAEGDEGTSRVRKLLGRRSRPSALVVEVGAVAGAILSIVALVQLVTPGGDDDGATTSAERPTPKVTLALPPNPVHRLSYGEWLASVGAGDDEVEALDQEERQRPGVTVDYELATEGYPAGTKLNMRYELWQRTSTGERKLEPTWDIAEIDRDPDTCTCSSTFVLLPDAEASYRLVVGVFPPEVMSGNPLKSAPTAFGPAS